METKVTTRGVDGEKEVHVGLPVSRGPRRLRLLLTRPYPAAGQVVEIPNDQIQSVIPVEAGPLGDDPEPAA